MTNTQDRREKIQAWDENYSGLNYRFRCVPLFPVLQGIYGKWSPYPFLSWDLRNLIPPVVGGDYHHSHMWSSLTVAMCFFSNIKLFLESKGSSFCAVNSTRVYWLISSRGRVWWFSILEDLVRSSGFLSNCNLIWAALIRINPTSGHHI